MRITSISISNYSYSTPNGSFILQDDVATVNVSLSESEAMQFTALAMNIFQSRQASIAQSIADMKPMQITGPSIEGEVIEDINHDGVPF